MKVELLDGDIIRKSLTRALGFSDGDRRMNIERVIIPMGKVIRSFLLGWSLNELIKRSPIIKPNIKQFTQGINGKVPSTKV